MTSTAERFIEAVDTKLRTVDAQHAIIEQILPNLLSFANILTVQFKDLNHCLSKTKLSKVAALERMNSDDLLPGLRNSPEKPHWHLSTYYDKATKEVVVGKPIRSVVNLRRAAWKDLAVFIQPYRIGIIEMIDALADIHSSLVLDNKLDLVAFMAKQIKLERLHPYSPAQVTSAEQYLESTIDAVRDDLLPRALELLHRIRDKAKQRLNWAWY